MTPPTNLAEAFARIETDLVRAVSAAERTATAPSKRNAAGEIARFHDEARPRFETEGYGVLSGLLGETTAAKAAFEVVEGLGLPTVFVFAFPGLFEFGIRACEALSAMGDYEMLEDFWGFSVAPGASGWPAHRGNSDHLLVREKPALLNLWGAVGDAPSDRACMYAVPLCADPGYPADLGRTDAPLEAVRGLPIADGDLLFWNANLLHWGGASSAFSHTQRRSVTVTLVERSAFLELRRATPLASATARERIDGIARQICIYGHVPPAVADWARFTVAARR